MDGDKCKQMEQVAKADGGLYFGGEAQSESCKVFFLPLPAEANSKLTFALIIST